MSISPSDEVTINLLKEEVQRYATHNGIQTCTFYRGGSNAAGMSSVYGTVRNHIEDRIKKVVNANPWMAGYLVSPTQFRYTKTVNDFQLKMVLGEESRETVSFTREDSYKDINLACLKLCGLCSVPHMVKSGQAISRIMVAPTNDDEAVLLFSMSHAVVDGYTYYRLLSMLGGAPVEAMEISRPTQAAYSTMEATLSGPDILRYGASATYIKHIVWNNVLCSKPHNDIVCRYVDPSRVEAAKADSNNKGPETPFVSTNDLLVSLVAKASTVNFMMQTLNYRNRTPLLGDGHAGNYENVLGYDETGYSTAGEIRKSLVAPPYGNIKSMPRFCSKTRMAFYTSWVFQKTSLPEIEGCSLELHLPVMNFDPSGNVHRALICPLDVAITFRPQPDRLAMIAFCCRANPESYTALTPSNVLCESLSNDVFPDGLTMSETVDSIEDDDDDHGN